MNRALLLAVLLLSSIVAWSHHKSSSPYQAEAQQALDFVCKQLDADCSEVHPPRVVITGLMDELGLYGLTPSDEPHIFVTSAELPDGFIMEVIVHETTHYVLFQLYPWVAMCDNELIARVVHAAWSGKEYDDSWRTSDAYPGCDGKEEGAEKAPSEGTTDPAISQ